MNLEFQLDMFDPLDEMAIQNRKILEIYNRSEGARKGCFKRIGEMLNRIKDLEMANTKFERRVDRLEYLISKFMAKSGFENKELLNQDDYDEFDMFDRLILERNA